MRILLAPSAFIIAIVSTTNAAPASHCRSCERSASPTQNHAGLVLARGGGMVRPQVSGTGGAPNGGGMTAGRGGGLGARGGAMNSLGGGMGAPGGEASPLGGGSDPHATSCPRGRARPKSPPTSPNLFSWLSPCGAKF